MKRLKRREFLRQLGKLSLLPFLPKLPKVVGFYGPSKFVIPAGFPSDTFPIRLTHDHVFIMPKGESINDFTEVLYEAAKELGDGSTWIMHPDIFKELE